MSTTSGSWLYHQQNPSNLNDITAIGGDVHHNLHQENGLSKDQSPQDGDKGQSNEGQDQGFYQCSTCKKTYNRADHLIRHVRSHTHEKPYVCEMCGKGFARPDLLKRHTAGHEDEERSPTEGSATKKRKIATNFNAPQTGRVTQACKACASSKLKCSEGKPCERCKKKRLLCEESSQNDGPQPSPDRGHANGFHARDGSYRDTTNAEQDVLQASQAEMGHPSSNPTSAHSEPVVAEGVLELNGAYFPEFLRKVVGEPGSSEPTARIDPTTSLNHSFFPQNYVDVAAEDGDYGWGADLWYSDGLRDAFDLPFESTFTPYAPTLSSSSENSTSAGVGVDAFKHSLIGSWTPHPEDSSMMERHNLIAPKNVDTMPIFTESKKILPEPLSLHARDRILGMVLETCPQAAASRIIASFPSAEFLNNCVQYYFCRRHEEQIDSYIHLPTLKPNDQRAELLAMLAGAGAVCTASSVIRKLGYALQEAVRHAVQRRVGRARPLTLLLVADDIPSSMRTMQLRESSASFKQPGFRPKSVSGVIHDVRSKSQKLVLRPTRPCYDEPVNSRGLHIHRLM